MLPSVESSPLRLFSSRPRKSIQFLSEIEVASIKANHHSFLSETNHFSYSSPQLLIGDLRLAIVFA